MTASAATYLQVRWRETGTQAWADPQRFEPAAEVVVAGLDREKEYDFEVRAISACGGKSAWVAGSYTVPAPPVGTIVLADVDTAASDAKAKTDLGLNTDGTITNGLNEVDFLIDGPLYGKPLKTRLSLGKPWVDLSESINTGRNADNFTETATRKFAGESGADVTGSHTAADTTNVAGTAAATVKGGALRANAGLDGSGDLARDALPGRIKYTGGATLDSLQPAEAGAQVVTGKSVTLLTDRTADNFTETATRKFAGESGADVTGSHTAADTTNVAGTAAATVKGGALRANAGLDGSGDLARDALPGRIKYTGGATLDSLQPAEAGAQVTTGKALTVLTGRTADNIAESATRKYAGESGATVGATWGATLTGRPTELTDGRVAAGLAADGKIASGLNDIDQIADSLTFRRLGASYVDTSGRAIGLWDGVGLRTGTQFKSDIDAALAAVDAISSDSVLSKGEKSAVILQVNAINGELAGIQASADAYAVSRVAFDAAYNSLTAAYLYGLTPGWNDVTADTNIVPTTYRTKWADYYTARQDLLNTISAKAKEIADDAKGKTDLGLNTDGTLKNGVTPIDRLTDGTYARTLATELTGGAHKLGIAGSGKLIGDQRNLPQALVNSYGSVASAETLSATSAGAVSVNAHTNYMGGSSAAYSAVSNAVTALTPGNSYAIYCSDPTFSGGTKSWSAATSVSALMQLGDGYYRAGTILIPISGSSGSGDGGDVPPDNYCVDWDTVLPDGRYLRDLVVGVDGAWCVDVRTGQREWVVLQAMAEGVEDCYLLTSQHGSIIQSVSTPMDLPDGRIVRTPDMRGELVLPWAGGSEPVVTLAPLGPRRVLKPDFGNRMFYAGITPDACLATHNARAK